MQSYAFSLAATTGRSIPVEGDFIAYESGSAGAGDTHITVKPDVGDEVILKPGQGIRLSQKATNWFIKVTDQASTVSGTLIIGEGDFWDSNTANLVTFTASQVPNSQALPVKKQALATITNFTPVTINTGAAQALVSDATQQILRIRNGHATATLYIGATGVTTVNAAIVLAPGDLWIEEEAAGAAWYATSDTAGCNVQIQGLKL